MNEKKITITHLLILSIIAIVFVVTVSFINSHFGKSSEISGPKNNKNLSPINPISNNSKVATTQDTLGYQSQYGALPNSLKGTTLDNALQVDEDGKLIITSDIKDLFDYFLSTISEESLETILLRIDEYLTHYLQEPALSESKRILAQYVEFKYSLMDLEQEMGDELTQMSPQDKINGGYLTFLRKQMDQRNAMREQYLDLEVYEAFYEEEQLYDEYTYSKLLVTSDQSLSDLERLDKITEYQNTLPEEMRQSIRKTQITDELKIRTEQLIANGGDQQQVRELRQEMFGDEAVQRFDELDQQRAQWKARIDSYLTQRANILNNQGLANEELNTQVDTLRASLFDKLEQIRVRNIERHTEV